MADDVLDFLPLFPSETEAAILARMIAWANEGLDPETDVEAWVDTRELGHWRTCVMPAVREIARLYDLAGTEVVAAGMPVWAWGVYLDDHAEVVDIVRLAATPADGIATFTGPADTVIAAGTTVGVEPVTPDQDVPEFMVTTGGTIPGVAAAPTGAAATLQAGGALTNGTVYRYVWTAVDDAGETTASAEVTATAGAVNKSIAVVCDAVPSALTYRLYRKTGGSAGPPYNLLAEVVTPSFTDAGAVVPNAAVHPPVSNTTGGIRRLPIQATDAGAFGNVAAGAVTEFSTPPPAGVEVTNEAAISGGTEAETDEGLRERVLGTFQGQGAGNKRDYERRGRDWQGVGRVTVIPLWDGPNTVKVIAMTADGQPVSQETIDGLQADMDPIPGKGEGWAPVGAIVTVGTASERSIEMAAVVECEPGYSLNGFGGTVALADRIAATLRAYVNNVEPGGEIVVTQLVRCIAGVTGVHDVHITSLEGVSPAVNVAIDDDPAEVPSLAAPTLTEGVL